MGQQQEKVKVSKKELDEANTMWSYFTEVTKWSIIVTAAILIILGVTLL